MNGSIGLETLIVAILNVVAGAMVLLTVIANYGPTAAVGAAILALNASFVTFVCTRLA